MKYCNIAPLRMYVYVSCTHLVKCKLTTAKGRLDISTTARESASSRGQHADAKRLIFCLFPKARSNASPNASAAHERPKKNIKKYIPISLKVLLTNHYDSTLGTSTTGNAISGGGSSTVVIVIVVVVVVV